ncbi:hypothetical protein K2X05_07710 [bacterium]|nr:hypothetical protein [bacterium]
MSTFLLYFAIFPLAMFLLSLVLPKSEIFISRFSLVAILSHAFLSQGFSLLWLFGDSSQIVFNGPALYSSGGIEFILSLMFDKITAVYSLVGSLLTSLIVIYSRIYLHRESGYKRFFCTILLFYTGFNVIIFSGNFEILFIGWEILGLSSFLLIGFYRDRYIPVKNAFKVFSIYRFGDVGLILTTWLCHLIWHKNIQFTDLSFLSQSHHMDEMNWLYLFLTLAILLSASAKSAQFPFCSWMPRAMEGPTPSSAIFYGSLSVHIGAFILLRTFPLWEGQTPGRVAIAVVGLLTAFVCNGCARVQSTIKSQVAYSSLTQIGLIFVEISLGLHNLALFHFAGNAFLRTYQLLVSPSVVSYLIREQFYRPAIIRENIESILPKKIAHTLYILSLKEWYMDLFLERWLWLPFKRVGNLLRKKPLAPSLWSLVLCSLLLVIFIPFIEMKDSFLLTCAASIVACIGFLFVVRSLTERQNPMTAWSLIFANHIWILLAVDVYDALNSFETIVYFSGVSLSWLGGLYILKKLMDLEKSIHLNSFLGLAQKHPTYAFWFLICSLGISGFPITPTFIGEDIVFHHIHRQELFVALFISLSYIFDGLCILRIYTRLFLGPIESMDKEVARRSS